MEVAHSVAATAGETEVDSVANQVNHNAIFWVSKYRFGLFMHSGSQDIDLASSCHFSFIDS